MTKREVEKKESQTMRTVALDPDTIIARSPEAVDAPSPPEHFIMHLTSGRCVSVDAVGMRIWQLLEPACTLAELVDRLITEFSGSRGAVDLDVRRCILLLMECDLVQSRGHR